MNDRKNREGINKIRQLVSRLPSFFTVNRLFMLLGWTRLTCGRDDNIMLPVPQVGVYNHRL